MGGNRPYVYYQKELYEYNDENSSYHDTFQPDTRLILSKPFYGKPEFPTSYLGVHCDIFRKNDIAKEKVTRSSPHQPPQPNRSSSHGGLLSPAPREVSDSGKPTGSLFGGSALEAEDGLKLMENSEAMNLVLHAGNTKALIVGEYSGIKVDLGKVPVLETTEGAIFESNSIARYVASLTKNSPLLGCSAIDKAHIDHWINFSAMEVDANILCWFIPRIGFAPYVSQGEENAVTCLKRALDTLNNHLADNTFLVGHAVTLADIIMTCNLVLGFSKVMTSSFTKDYPHVERYFWTMVNQPNIKKVLGEVKQTDSVPPVQAAQKPVAATERELEVKKRPLSRNEKKRMAKEERSRFWECL